MSRRQREAARSPNFGMLEEAEASVVVLVMMVVARAVSLEGAVLQGKRTKLIKGMTRLLLGFRRYFTRRYCVVGCLGVVLPSAA